VQSTSCSPEQIIAEMNRLLASREFANAERLGRFLRYVVERTLAGDRDCLKESIIGMEVFDRGADYNPKSEPIVRTEARRLRARLEEYYQDSSRSSPVRILIPKGSYVAVFEPAFPAAPAVEPEPPAPPPPPRSRKPLLAGAVAVALVALTVVLYFRMRPHAPVLDHLIPFTTQRGEQRNARLTPAGDILAFDCLGPGDRFENVYAQRLDASEPVRLGKDIADERSPVWSPDGRQIAFLREIAPDRTAIFTRPLVGAGERKWVEFGRGATPRLDWSPDGKWFAFAEPAVAGRNSSVVLMSLATGEKRVLTTPPEEWRGDSLPTFSPDSSRIVFRRTQPPSGEEDLYQVPVAGGQPKRLTFDNRGISGFAFTPDGGLVFSSKRMGSIRGLFWMPPGGGRMLRITSAVVDAASPTISHDGKHFAFSRVSYDVNIWRVNADGRGAAAAVVDSELADTSPQFSPDGRHIVFQSNRSGSEEVWVSDTTGANPSRLTDGGGAVLGVPHWSPDGAWIAFEWHKTGRAAIYLVGAQGGTVRPLVEDGYRNQSPAWSRDSQFIYFGSNRSGRPEIWKAPVQGGAPISVIRRPGFAPAESPGGEYLYWNDPATHDIWRQSLTNGASAAEGASPERILAGRNEGDWGNWAVGRKGIYYVDRGPGSHDAAILYRDFASQAVRTVHVFTKPPIWGTAGLAISPDESTVLFCQIDHSGSNIFVQ
jgi:Tol biopolymer transport system component